MRSLLLAATAIPAGAPPSRYWLESLSWAVPGPSITRWLLVADLLVLLSIAARFRQGPTGIVLAVGLGFFALNVISMILTDFFLGLAVFHGVTGLAGLLTAGPARWAGGTLLAITLVLGALT